MADEHSDPKEGDAAGSSKVKGRGYYSCLIWPTPVWSNCIIADLDDFGQRLAASTI